ncbi:four helix bundle protein [Stygiobacter electus]|uniref:Four helix bundle protein n=1 Tax=Stygiobacter electus TaxID=3032292 RepID=A0AAE3P2A7_9BACT|nr:four helix bundle protein [Stygiobacter electus]MDF1613079.1 four helix bundle protein [Stygiobacter electus]
MDEGLGNRIFLFVVNIIKFCKTLNYSIENKVIINQLIKSATSVGANYEEAQGGSSKADFRNKIKISLKEIRETNYWLRILKAIDSDNKFDELIDESEQLKRILGKISSTSR